MKHEGGRRAQRETGRRCVSTMVARHTIVGVLTAKTCNHFLSELDGERALLGADTDEGQPAESCVAA